MQVINYIAAIWSYDFDVGTVTDVQACLDAAYDANSTFEAISFYNETGGCSYYSDLHAIFLQAPDGVPYLWVRVDRHMQMAAMASCLTDQDAMYLLTQMTYKGETCWKPKGSEQSVSLDPTTGLCASENYGGTFYHQQAGELENGTAYCLSRAQAVDAVNYLCDVQYRHKKMFFGDTWYCYYAYELNSTEQVLGASLISGDYCSQLFGSTAHVVKISEPREYEWLYGQFGSVHLGLTLRSGTTYQWYDGTVASNLPWSVGSPQEGTNKLVRIDGSRYYVEDMSPASPAYNITTLICKKPAAHNAYDACAKFITCT